MNKKIKLFTKRVYNLTFSDEVETVIMSIFIINIEYLRISRMLIVFLLSYAFIWNFINKDCINLSVKT